MTQYHNFLLPHQLPQLDSCSLSSNSFNHFHCQTQHLVYHTCPANVYGMSELKDHTHEGMLKCKFCLRAKVDRYKIPKWAGNRPPWKGSWGPINQLWNLSSMWKVRKRGGILGGSCVWTEHQGSFQGRGWEHGFTDINWYLDTCPWGCGTGWAECTSCLEKC